MPKFFISFIFGLFMLEQVCAEIFYRDAKKLFPNLFNITFIKENTHNYNFFRIKLKETEEKGIGIFSTRKIPSHRTILYYRLKIYDTNNYQALNDAKYSFSIFDKNNGNIDHSKIADIFKDSNDKPRGRKPYWVLKYLFFLKNKHFFFKGYFVNEPNSNQIENVIVYLDQKNYNTTIGNILEYRMMTKKTVESGEEITWFFFIFFFFLING